MEAVDAATTLRTFAAAAASITLNVPLTRTSTANRGSSAHCVIRSAAWWKTTSTALTTSRTSARSVMSPSITLTLPLASAHARLSRRPRTKLSRTTISPTPCRTSSSARFEPIVPAPPVIRTRSSRITVDSPAFGSQLFNACAAGFLPRLAWKRRSRPVACGSPEPQSLGGNVADDDRPHADHRALADGDSFPHKGPSTDVRAGGDTAVAADANARRDGDPVLHAHVVRQHDLRHHRDMTADRHVRGEIDVGQ